MKRRSASAARWVARRVHLAMIVALVPAAAQAGLGGPEAATQSIFTISKLPGETVTEARTQAPETEIAIEGYRVERVALPAPIHVKIEGRRVQKQDAFRVTVFFGRPLTVRDQGLSLVFDGHWCGFLQEGWDLLSAEAICFDGSLLKEGAALGVTYQSVSLRQKEEGSDIVGPDAAFDGEDVIHYSSALLRLGTGR